MTWRATTFGPELQRRRTRAGITQLELAECVRRHGFSSARAPSDADVARGIDVIESGGVWPFEEGPVQPPDVAPEQCFRDAAVACLCDGDQACGRALTDAMSQDIMDSFGLVN